MIDPGKRLFRPGRGLAALAVSAMLIGGVAIAAHGATATFAQTPAATSTAAAGGPPPLPTLPPKTATPSGPPPLPTVASTPAKTAVPTAAPAKTPVSTQAPKPAAQAPAAAQKPAAAPAAVQLPNTGNGGVTGSDSSPLLPAAAGFGAIVLVAGGAYALRSRKHED